MKRKLIILTVLTCIAGYSYGQTDKHFSMFSDTKVQLNPATSGFYSSKVMIQANFRQQWTAGGAPFRTYSASYDMRIYQDQFAQKFVSGGAYFFNDITGDNKYVQTNFVVPVSYALKLNEYNYLSFGVSPGFFQRSLRDRTFSWSSQWTGSEFNTDIDSRESILGERYTLSKFDVGAGMYWESELSELNKIGVGVSGFHLAKPKVNFFEEKERLDRTLNVQFFGEFGRDGLNVTFKPGMMYAMQGTNKYLVFGSNFDLLIKGESIHTGYYNRTSLEFGAHMRLNDAVILNAKLHNGAFTMGYAYDIIVSGLNSSVLGPRGASEFFLSYQIGTARVTKIDLDDE